MRYKLRNCRTGEKEFERETTLEICEKDGILTFIFTAKNCKYYCLYEEYNKIHAEGDVCEVFIGTDPNRKVYYEMEITPHNALMLAKITYLGENCGAPVVQLEFLEKNFVKTQVLMHNNGYVVTLSFAKSEIVTGNGDVFFNAYRIDTDGGRLLNHDQLGYALNPTMRSKFHTPSKFVLLKDYL